MRRITPSAWRAAVGTMTVALFAACSTSPSTSPQQPVLTQPEANAVAEVVATDAASLAGGATLDAATGMPFAAAPMPGAPAMAMPTTGTTRSVVENGVRSVVPTADQVQLADTMTTAYTFASGTTASHVRKWLATFTADQAGSIQVGSRLPSGDWTIAGTSAYTSGTNSYSLSVTTSDPLHYNTSCSVEPRFDSGRLTVQVTNGTTSTTVTITFTGCGQYSVSKSAA